MCSNSKIFSMPATWVGEGSYVLNDLTPARDNRVSTITHEEKPLFYADRPTPLPTRPLATEHTLTCPWLIKPCLSASLAALSSPPWTSTTQELTWYDPSSSSAATPPPLNTTLLTIIEDKSKFINFILSISFRVRRSSISSHLVVVVVHKKRLVLFSLVPSPLPGWVPSFSLIASSDHVIYLSYFSFSLSPISIMDTCH